MKKIINPWQGMKGYNCFGCSGHNASGLKMEFYEDGNEIVCYWRPESKYQGWLDTLHGGIQSVLLDEICCWVVLRKLQTTGVTSRMEIRYRHPVSTNDGVLELRASIKEQKRNILLIEARLYDGSKQLCTEALCTYFTFPQEKAEKEMYFMHCGLEEDEKETTRLQGHVVDVVNCRIFDAEVLLAGKRIKSVTPMDLSGREVPYLMPGFIDAHIHIESSMMLPSEFAKIAVRYGTVGIVADPHEIANVLGVEGMEYLINDGKRVPFHFWFGAPSCVPATPFETSGATLDASDIRRLMARQDIHFLAEMMNYPGVLNNDSEVLAKIAAAKEFGKPIDGHAPGVLGKALEEYAQAGISTDHECSTMEEACQHLKNNMKVLLREGSAARDFENLMPLLQSNDGMLMFCSDDKHPDELMQGHINQLVVRAIAAGYPLWNVLRAACLTPVEHYGMNCGLLRANDSADFIVVDNLSDFNLLATYIAGRKVYDKASGTARNFCPNRYPNNFHTDAIKTNELRVPYTSDSLPVIVASDMSLVTTSCTMKPLLQDTDEGRFVVPDVTRDMLKIVVYNRYHHAAPQIAFIKGFGLKNGALASTIAHDSHNIIAVGTNDEDIICAINHIIDSEGGIAVCNESDVMSLPLPIGGLISPLNGEEVAQCYKELNDAAHRLGATFNAPFMTLAFMALLVIPELKLSDKGLFDSKTFRFVSGGK